MSKRNKKIKQEKTIQELTKKIGLSILPQDKRRLKDLESKNNIRRKPKGDR